ncbi:MAG: thiamine ABC transporter substrate-binding protein [Candidatus Kariarchaeaceae archaeon]|jgi:thiamine transport system substrate-binding protein
MNRIQAVVVSVIIIVGIGITGFFIFTSLSDEKKLVIYAYDSLFVDPGYAFDRAFEEFAGIESGSVQIVYLSDAGVVLNRAIAEKDSPVADILIGIDNILVDKARKNDILKPYKPNGHENIINGLVENLAPDYLITPYEYGITSLWYLKDYLEGSINGTSFTLNDLPQFASQTVVEDPRLSTPGLGFLLHTIAIFGDEDAGVTGVIDGSWEQFWADLVSNDLRIVPSWSIAFELIYTPEEGRPMIVSYTSSPAYGSCLYDDTSSDSVLTHETGTKWGWQQIEGIGLVKSAEHEDLAKEFIDWFISEELQSQIYLNQWVYPAITGITAPSCYDIVIPFEDITPLNDKISIDILSENLDIWLDKWEIVVAT